MSAARQGCELRGEKLYKHFEKVDWARLMNKVRDSRSFDAWHCSEVEKLHSQAKISIGWAAKMINMMTKVRVYIAKEGDSELARLIHPPIDRRLLDRIKDNYPEEFCRLAPLTKSIVGIQTYEQYQGVIKIIREIAHRRGCSLFEVEQLWDPENS